MMVSGGRTELRIGDNEPRRSRVVGGGGYLQRQVAQGGGILFPRVSVRRSKQMFSSWSPIST